MIILFVASLYDQKAKLRADYSNLNKFRVRLSTKKEASLAKLPPYEAIFHQHALRASLQTYIWKSSQKAQPQTS
jgi:L-lactate utilization protein LutB